MLYYPSVLKAIAENSPSSKKALGIDYPGKGKAAIAAYYDASHYELLFMNPYSGEVLKHKNMNKDFFRLYWMDIFIYGYRRISASRSLPPLR